MNKAFKIGSFMAMILLSITCVNYDVKAGYTGWNDTPDSAWELIPDGGIKNKLKEIYKNNPNGKYTGEQCNDAANRLWREIFGTEMSRVNGTATRLGPIHCDSIDAVAKPGDYIYCGRDEYGYLTGKQHYGIYLGCREISGKKFIYLYEGNYNNTLVINFGKGVPVNYFGNVVNQTGYHYYVYHATNYDTINGPSDTKKPTISNVKISNLSANGYTVSCTVKDNVGIKEVKFPTWTAANGQDDLIWHVGTLKGNKATCNIKTKDHKNEINTTYVTHIYAYDTSGNEAGPTPTSIMVIGMPTAKDIMSNSGMNNNSSKENINNKEKNNNSNPSNNNTTTKNNGGSYSKQDSQTNEMVAAPKNGVSALIPDLVKDTFNVFNPYLTYSAHCENIGWMDSVSEKKTAGTTGQGLRMEALMISLNNGGDSQISAEVHLADVGWVPATTGSTIMVGTEGESRAIEAIKLNLTGSLKDKYSIYYRVHVMDIGWMDWVKDGEMAGTTGEGRRAEAIEIYLVKK